MLIDDDELQLLVGDADRDGDGSINFEGFLWIQYYIIFAVEDYEAFGFKTYADPVPT